MVALKHNHGQLPEHCDCTYTVTVEVIGAEAVDALEQHLDNLVDDEWHVMWTVERET